MTFKNTFLTFDKDFLQCYFFMFCIYIMEYYFVEPKKKKYKNYTVLEMKNCKVKGQSPLIALRKVIRKFIRVVEEKGGDKFGLKNESVTILDEDFKRFEYIFSIVKKEEQKENIFASFDYEIVVYKMLAKI